MWLWHFPGRNGVSLTSLGDARIVMWSWRTWHLQPPWVRTSDPPLCPSPFPGDSSVLSSGPRILLPFPFPWVGAVVGWDDVWALPSALLEQPQHLLPVVSRGRCQRQRFFSHLNGPPFVWPCPGQVTVQIQGTCVHQVLIFSSSWHFLMPAYARNCHHWRGY